MPTDFTKHTEFIKHIQVRVSDHPNLSLWKIDYVTRKTASQEEEEEIA